MKITFPLRLKLAFSQSVLIVLSIIAISIAALCLVVADKQSYLYDNIFQTTNFQAIQIKQFIEQKELLTELLIDKKYQDFSKFGIIDIKEFYKDGDFATHYINHDIKRFYLPDTSYTKGVEEDYPTKDKTLIIYGGKYISHLRVDRKLSNNKFFRVRYSLDDIFEKSLSRGAYLSTLLDNRGNVIYSNYQLEEDIKKTFKERISDLNKKRGQGVAEITIGKTEYISANVKISLSKDVYLISEISKDKAYNVTKKITYTIICIALFLVGTFNIVSMLLARTITTPLSRILDSINLFSKGNYSKKLKIKTRDELSLVANSFNKMTDEITKYHEKLKEYNATLEQKVEQRTKELKDKNIFIKTVLDSLDQGLVIFNKDGKCLPTYTKISEEIFSMNPSNKNLIDVINKHEEKEIITKWIKTLYLDKLPFSSISGLGPKYLPKTEDQQRHIKLKYFPMYNSKKKLENVILLATDETKEYKAKKELEKSKDEMKVLSKLISNKEDFLSLVKLIKDSYTKDIPNYIQLKQKDNLLRILHSLKGTSAIYGLSHLADTIHRLEQSVIDMTDLNYQSLEIEDKLHKSLEEELSKIKQTLGDDYFDEDKLYITKESVQNIYDHVDNKDSKLFHSLEKAFFHQDLVTLMMPYNELVRELSKRLSKKVKPININGEATFDKRKFERFFKSLVHVFRNSLDHGIELPSKRIENKKEDEGEITVSAEIENNMLIFQIKDDGAGISPDRIRSKMKSLSYPEDRLNEDDSKIIYAIFDSEFSTNETVTDLSGRGVGLHDVLIETKNLNGRIELQSKTNQGTSFKFFFPI